MARVLCVGVATLDLVFRVDRYPEEDAEVRASALDWRCGGNAANTAIVLSRLGERAFWTGNLGDAPQTRVIEAAFDRHGVDRSLARRIPGGGVPTSSVVLSAAGASRTIVHHRDLPEYAAEDFLALDLRGFDWIHFEGRAVDALPAMLERARAQCGLPVSLEIEKPRPGIEALVEQVDLALFSRAHVRAVGGGSPESFLEGLPDGLMAACAWGAEGAWARDFAGRVHHRPAWVPERVVDTLGAGDVFNAGMIHALAGGRPMPEALAFAVELAGRKCGHEGVVPDG